jgi:hypothetical protein
MTCCFCSTFVIKSCEYQSSPSARRDKLEVYQCILQNVTNIDDDQRETLAALQKIKTGGNNPGKWRQLFEETDTDGNGVVDREELQRLLHKMGFIGSEGFISELLDQYGADDSDCINLTGFISFVKNEYANACMRVEELTTARVMSLSPDVPSQYKPPKTGLLTLTLVDGLQKKAKARVVSKGIAQAAKELGGNEKKMLLKFTMDSSIFRLNDALMILKLFYADGASKHACVSEVLQRLDSPTEVRSFLRKVLNNYDFDMLMLKKFMGPALEPILGHFNGYYSLDLSNPLDQFCLRKLLIHNDHIIAKRKKWLAARCANFSAGDGASTARRGPTSSIGDTSQHNNWSCFRNVVKNNAVIHVMDVITTSADSIPTSGKLSFDFVSVARPNGHNVSGPWTNALTPDEDDGVDADTICVSDQRFVYLLSQKLTVIDVTDQFLAQKYLRDKRIEMAKGLLCPDTASSHEWSQTRAKVCVFRQLNFV